MWRQLRRWIGRDSAAPAVAAALRTPEPAYGSWTPTPAWIGGRLGRPITYISVGEPALDRLRRESPATVAAVVGAAERAARHEFDLLGSGPFHCVDPDRPNRDGYQPIDWYFDPVRRLRFPSGVHHKAWKLYEMRPGNADVKYPWELARCQHWVTLGQAYRLTGDHRFAAEIANQLADFVEANPVGVGINWTCTMDVGLRAVSWIAALDLVRDAALDAAFWPGACRALFDHGLFIRANLENTYEVTSNHFLSNVLGLWFLAAMFDDVEEGRAWGAFARESLEAEIDVQVLPDGADFESSVPYHRLVTELFMGGARLADVRGEPLSDHYRSRVGDMAAYLADVTRPDGLMPQVGDADDGRLHICGEFGSASPQDGRHLLGPAAAMFGRSEWMAMGGAAASWEAAWWGFDVGAPAAAPVATPVARLFPDAGHAVVRDGGTYLLVANSIVGTRGFGNHKHNDQLGFEYHAGGGPLVVDPGSYVYTSDPDARNLFRSTGYHNTLMIDGAEQNKVNPEWLFRMFEQARAEHVSFSAGDAVVEYHGRHHGYEVLADPVTHDRVFRLEPATGRLSIVDRLSGAGAHQLAWHFHFAPGVVAALEPGACRLQSPWAAAVIEYPRDCHAELNAAWYSPSYGVRTACQALNLRVQTRLESVAEWRFSIVPAVAVDA